MNLHNTSYPATSKPEELVPSRYALKVGEIEVLVVSDGVLPLPTTMLAHNADPAVRATWLHDMFLPQDAFDWALNAVVVRSGDKTILIDAGLGSDPDLHLPRAGQLIKRLEAAGIDLSSVTDLVLTHLHMDHIGGLLVDGVKERLRKDLSIIQFHALGDVSPLVSLFISNTRYGSLAQFPFETLASRRSDPFRDGRNEPRFLASQSVCARLEANPYAGLSGLCAVGGACAAGSPTGRSKYSSGRVAWHRLRAGDYASSTGGRQRASRRSSCGGS